MNRRRLFQTFAAATLAAAMDVVGLKPIDAPKKVTLDELFASDAEKMARELHNLGYFFRESSANLLQKFPENAGYAI